MRYINPRYLLTYLSTYVVQDGKVMTSSAHIRLEYSDGVCRLTIDSITVDDEAEYMCEARNEHGVANTWAEVLVESKQALAPMFHPRQADLTPWAFGLAAAAA